jgi:hypothetical protein
VPTASPTRSVASVNGKIMRVGEAVGTSRIVEILPNAIVLESPSGVRRTIERRGSAPRTEAGAR